MSLTVQKALESRAVLADLVSKDKENKYVFSGATRIKLALNLRKLNPIQDEFQKENTDLIKLYGKPIVDEDGKSNPENIAVAKDSPEFELFQAKQKELLEADSEVTLSPVSQEDLVGKEGDPRSNQIHIDLLGLLFEVGLVTE